LNGGIKTHTFRTNDGEVRTSKKRNNSREKKKRSRPGREFSHASQTAK